MLKSAIRNLVFDMGNVLLLFDADVILRRAGIDDADDRRLFERVIMASDVWQDYDRGTVEKTAFRPLIDSLPPHLADIAEEMLLRHIFAATYMPPIEPMETLAAAAHERGYDLYLLSNAGQDFHIYRKGIPALRFFRGTFVSSDYHLMKPERAIYEKFFSVFSLRPEDCLFIDDLQTNIDGAARCGMDGICFNASKEKTDVLYEKLAAKGVVLR